MKLNEIVFLAKEHAYSKEALDRPRAILEYENGVLRVSAGCSYNACVRFFRDSLLSSVGMEHEAFKRVDNCYDILGG